MLQQVELAPKSLDSYENVIGTEAMNELRELAAPLLKAKIAHINSTSYGGGVSELLRSMVPFYRGLGLSVDWMVIPPEEEFFTVTKGIHNALQGASFVLTEEAQNTYIRHSERIAGLMEGEYDYIVVHDPQPAALLALHGRNSSRCVWRCHLDTSEPNEEVMAFLKPFIAEYDALVFTMEQFVPRTLREQRHVIIPPAIDPLSPKNMTLPSDISNQIINWTGVRLDQLLITQVSRFDPWKDPLGVIEVYRTIKKDLPNVQLALMGQMALDDPEGWEMYRDIVEESKSDPDIYVLTNFTGIGNMEVNAFQSSSNVVLQKSLREGFGLVVSEALWKGTPVVAGMAGGIPMQMPEGTGGYLVKGVDECAERTLELLRDPRKAQDFGASGRAHVQQNFLINRLMAYELRLLGSL